eukprot:TRINITY_DN3618_c0_g1_i5.p1 TRINITY_DN3618_c0_g1~~TRINITY_DN3618_c0_g1_i5.p1  ORF type:complete len:487 (-),score=100.01 TRINITY_DN3618_c0_g1_i5:468-1928(-)
MYGQYTLLREAVCGKTVVVTGASDGIGAHLASRLACAGARVVLVARSPEKLKAVGDSIRSSGGSSFEYVANLAKQEDCERVVKEIAADHAVDIFVSNAGRSIRRSVEYQATDRFHDFHRLMALNYFGALNLILGVLPGMRQRGAGHIVHVSSFGVTMRQPRFAGYVASKSALDTALQSIAAEVKAHGIHTSSVYMPLVQTKMVETRDHTYDHLYLLKLDEACELIERAIITKEQEVMDLPSRVVNFAYFFLPWIVTAIMARVYKLEREKPPDEYALPVKPTRPAKKPRASPMSLRALGTFLWLVHVLEAPLSMLIYFVTPILSAIFVLGPVARETIFFLRALRLRIHETSVQLQMCVLMLALAWSGNISCTIGVASINVALSVAVALSKNERKSSCESGAACRQLPQERAATEGTLPPTIAVPSAALPLPTLLAAEPDGKIHAKQKEKEAKDDDSSCQPSTSSDTDFIVDPLSPCAQSGSSSLGAI